MSDERRATSDGQAQRLGDGHSSFIAQHAALADEVALRVEGVRKRYGRVTALDGVGLAVRRGEIFGLLGANGAGKTTLIKILVGAARPDAGAVTVLGLDPARQARALRRQIGYMPQAPALYEDLSPRENVHFFGRAHPLERLEERIDEVLTFTGLRERERDPVYGFSGGMKQRVSLACALVHRPLMLFLDEPTAGVDPKLREAFWQHFRDLAERGATLVVSTHLMDEAHFCDRLAIMRDGAVLACDTPRNLLRRGRTLVSVWRGEQVERRLVTDYPRQLPALLRPHGLDPAIDRIEIEEDTLDTVVLDLIDEQSAVGSQPSAAGRDRGVARAAAPTDRVPLEE
ncbi:MAG TPA: ABC transporter ATP-binding protein [Thermomicrobiales bacterium]|nr:ABC transporter ATP-binding protein [Thermomicrobiales bacterium]